MLRLFSSFRDQVAKGSWQEFNRLLSQSSPGNGGKIGFYFKEPEITPRTNSGTHRFDKDDRPVNSFEPASKFFFCLFQLIKFQLNNFIPKDEVRAVVEGQFLSMAVHSQNIGLTPKKIFATGGASQNEEIIKIMSNVFGVPVYTHSQPNSASLGAAYRALHGWKCFIKGSFVSFDEDKQLPFTLKATPDPEISKIYQKMVQRYRNLEKQVVI